MSDGLWGSAKVFLSSPILKSPSPRSLPPAASLGLSPEKALASPFPFPLSWQGLPGCQALSQICDPSLCVPYPFPLDTGSLVAKREEQSLSTS